jgi:hypothetical protein
MSPSRYTQLMQRAQERLRSIEHTSIASQFGAIEYAGRGEGYPTLITLQQVASVLPGTTGDALRLALIGAGGWLWPACGQAAGACAETKSLTASMTSAGCSRCGLWPARSMIRRRAPGIPAASSS